MNAGFSSLARLKAQTLPPAMRERTDFDEQLKTLGIGVALMMQGFCDRLLMRKESDVLTTGTANNTVFSLPRYPLEEVVSVTLHTDVAALITADVASVNKAAGLLHFHRPPGGQHDKLVIAYTGGFWWDTTEDDTGVMPEAAAPLPEDILTAFYLQAQHVCESKDLFGLVAASSGDKPKPVQTSGVQLLPMVQAILNPHRRFG